MPGRYNMVVPIGATFERSLTWYTDDAETLPRDLTGWSARLQVRKTAAASGTLLALTSASGITLGGVAGTIAIEIAAATTAGIPPGTYRYDLEMVDPSGKVRRLMEGTIQFTYEVTR